MGTEGAQFMETNRIYVDTLGMLRWCRDEISHSSPSREKGLSGQVFFPPLFFLPSYSFLLGNKSRIKSNESPPRGSILYPG